MPAADRRYECSPGEESTSSQLEHTEIAADALGCPLRVQMDDRVGDTELRALHCLPGCVLTYPERRDGQSGETPSEAMQESSEVGVVDSEVSYRLETIDHDDAGTVLLHQGIDTVEHTDQAVAVECITQIVIEDGISNLFRVEEDH